MFKGRKINIISNLCPDYDNKKIGKDLYSYTFEQLNEKGGLEPKTFRKY